MNLSDSNHFLPLKTTKLDYCWHYVPRYSLQNFQQEVSHTQDALLEYLPEKIQRYHENFERVTLRLSVVFWVFDLSFVLWCHKIKYIDNIFRNYKWGTFMFKFGMLIGPLYAFMLFQKNARQLHLKQIYHHIKYNYRKYSRNGDITALNKEIPIIQKQ